MIHLRNVKLPDGRVLSYEIDSEDNREIDAGHLTMLPGLIDPHVHFRTPGLEHKEDWKTASKAAIAGGITTVFDMPNTIPACITQERLVQKKQLIDQQLKEGGIPLRYHLYLGADKSHFDEIYKAKKEVIGLKIFMGASTGGLVMDDESSLHAAFSLAHSHDLVVAVHAEDEKLIHERTALYKDNKEPNIHSLIRNREVAYNATKQAIDLARIYKTRLYLLHISTKEELDLIAKAKKEGLAVYAETTPHHLFLTEDAYKTWGLKVQMNPPLRERKDTDALWEAIKSGVIDTIGSDHAPHTLEEKNQPYGKAPSGIPGVETTLPLLLNACNEGKITLPQIVSLMRDRIEKIFRLPSNADVVLVDMNKVQTLKDEKLKTKCGWSPYAGMSLKGWPVMTILKGKIYETP